MMLFWGLTLLVSHTLAMWSTLTAVRSAQRFVSSACIVTNSTPWFNWCRLKANKSISATLRYNLYKVKAILLCCRHHSYIFRLYFYPCLSQVDWVRMKSTPLWRITSISRETTTKNHFLTFFTELILIGMPANRYTFNNINLTANGKHFDCFVSIPS